MCSPGSNLSNILSELFSVKFLIEERKVNFFKKRILSKLEKNKSSKTHFICSMILAPPDEIDSYTECCIRFFDRDSLVPLIIIHCLDLSPLALDTISTKKKIQIAIKILEYLNQVISVKSEFSRTIILNSLRYYFKANIPFALEYNYSPLIELKAQILKKHAFYVVNSGKVGKIEEKTENKDNRLKRIGLIRESYKNNSELKVTMWALKNIDPKAFEVYLLSFDLNAENIEKSFPAKHVHLPISNLMESIQIVQDIHLDMLINTTSISGRYWNEIAIILLSKPAKKQAMLLAEICTSGISEVDYFFVSDGYQLEEEHFIEKVVKVKSLNANSLCLIKPPCSSLERESLRRIIGLDSNTVVYISNAHLFKINKECIISWCRILSLTKNSRMILMPFPDERRWSYHDQFVEWLKEVCNDHKIDFKRFILLSTYGKKSFEMLGAADVFLDTSPYNGSISVFEALNQGLPVVSIKGSYYRSQFAIEQMELFGLSGLILNSHEEYISYAVRLANNESERTGIREKLLRKVESILKNNSSVPTTDLIDQIELLTSNRFY